MSEPQKSRDQSFDILKGVLILSVVLLHSSGRSASELVAKDSVEWWILRCINWGFCFAVPCFLFVSAILWSRSQIARGSWNGYFKRRIKSILGPYVIWTGIYWLFRLLIEHSMLKPRESGGIVSRTQIPVRLYELFFGKAYFHLYFMFVLLQFALLFPLLYWLIKRSKIESFWLMCLIAVVVQYGVFYVYRSLYSPLYSLVVFRSPSSYMDFCRGGHSVPRGNPLVGIKPCRRNRHIELHLQRHHRGVGDGNGFLDARVVPTITIEHACVSWPNFVANLFHSSLDHVRDEPTIIDPGA